MGYNDDQGEFFHRYTEEERKEYGDFMWYGGLGAGMVIGVAIGIVIIAILLAYGP